MKIKYLTLMIVLIMVIPMISAFSVSYPYTKERPFFAGPGETGEFEIQVQSSLADKSETVKIEILEGSEIISVDESLVEVRAQQIVPIRIKASVPAQARESTEYKVLMKFSSVNPAENQGTLTFDKSYMIGFNVVAKTSENPVVAEPEKSDFWWWILILIILIAIAIILYIYFKQKKKGKRK